MQRDFEAMSEAMSVFREEIYIEDFNLKQNCIDCRNRGYKWL